MPQYSTFDEAAVRRGIEAWLPGHLGVTDLEVIELKTPAMSGASALTFLFTTRHRDADGVEREEGFVARVVPTDPNEGGLFFDYDLEMEAAVARAAAKVVPVPEIVAVEPRNTEVF